jgi:hypothetical protein
VPGRRTGTVVEVVEVAVAQAPPAARRRPTSMLALALDTVLALALAGAAGALGLLPVPVALTAAVVWPVLLLTVGRYRSRTLGESRTHRALVVVGTGLRGAVLLLAASPWVTGVDLVAVAALVAALGVASGAHHLVAWRSHRPRLVLAGRHRDVRDAMVELGAADNHDIVAVCLTRASKNTFGDVPTYVGVDAAAGAADRHQADALVVLPGADRGQPPAASGPTPFAAALRGPQSTDGGSTGGLADALLHQGVPLPAELRRTAEHFRAAQD